MNENTQQCSETFRRLMGDSTCPPRPLDADDFPELTNEEQCAERVRRWEQRQKEISSIEDQQRRSKLEKATFQTYLYNKATEILEYLHDPQQWPMLKPEQYAALMETVQLAASTLNEKGGK